MKNGQLMLSIGALLAAEREKRGIPVEKAAKETRMRPQRIRDMEGDDLSHFTNPSYARMFIIAYAKYLGVSMQTICDHLPDRGELGTEGYQYISTSTEDLPSLRHDIASKPARRTPLVALVVTLLALVVVGLGGLGYYLIVTAPRITAALDKPPPAPEPEPTPVPSPPPAPVTIADMKLSNLKEGGEGATAFDGQVVLDAPPTPAPTNVIVEKPAPNQDATAAPAAAMDAEDRAFLLGTSPDQKPAPAR
jgi:cytoskeleton protein RodZ